MHLGKPRKEKNRFSASKRPMSSASHNVRSASQVTRVTIIEEILSFISLRERPSSRTIQ